MRNRSLLLTPFLLLAAHSLAAAEMPRAFDVTQYGANGDGKTLSSPSINKTIDAAAAGGGTVYVPAGTFLSGSIRLKSNVALYLEQGATPGHRRAGGVRRGGAERMGQAPGFRPQPFSQQSDLG